MYKLLREEIFQTGSAPLILVFMNSRRPLALVGYFAAHKLRAELILFLLALMGGNAGSQVFQWDTNTMTSGAQGAEIIEGWSAGPFWWNGISNVTWTNGSDAVFGGVSGVVLNDLAVTVDDISFTVPGYMLQANGADFGVRLGGGEGEHVITVAENATINHRLLGTEGFTKEGSGVLSLGAANHSFVGTITINAGEVRIAGGFIDSARSVVLANAPGAKLTIDGMDQILGGISGGGAAGGEVRINGSLIAGLDNVDHTFNGVVTGNGSLVKRGSGTLSLTNSNSTYSGPTFLDEGILSVTDLADDGIPSALGLSGYIKVGNGTALRYTGTAAVSTDRRLEFVGTGNIDVASPEGTVTLEGVISGSLQKNGAGTLHLNSSQTYTGPITVNAGTLKLSGSEAISEASLITLKTGAVLNLTASNQNIGSISGNGDVLLGSGNQRIESIIARNVQIGPGDRRIESINAANVQLGSGNLQIPSGSIGVISGSGSLEKVGAGGLSLGLGGPSTSGSLRISEGTVFFSGNVTPSSIPVILGTATTSGALVNEFASGVTPTLVLTGPLTVSAGGGSLRGFINVAGPLEGTGELNILPLNMSNIGGVSLTGAGGFSGTVNVKSGLFGFHAGLDLRNATMKVEAGTAAVVNGPGSPFIHALEGYGTISTGSGPPGSIRTDSLFLGGMLNIEIQGADPSKYGHIEVSGPVRLNGTVLFVALLYNPVDNVDVFRIIMNDGNDPTVLENPVTLSIFGTNRVLSDGDTFGIGFINQPGFQLFQVRFGLDGADNDVRLIAIPESSSMLMLLICLPTVLSRNCLRRCSRPS